MAKSEAAHHGFMHNQEELDTLIGERAHWINWPMNKGNRNGQTKLQVINNAAKKAAALDRSDPFVFKRVKSHLISGVMTPNDVK